MFSHLSVKELLLLCTEKQLELDDAGIDALRADPRKSVQSLAAKLSRIREKSREAERTETEMLRFECGLWQEGYRKVLGMDEVGRGPLAGPVCVAGVMFSPDGPIPKGIRDSKALSSSRRNELAPTIRIDAVGFAIACRDEKYIDAHGINRAIASCQHEIIDSLEPDFLLLDGFDFNESCIAQRALIKGDQRSVSIAAASIVAKVHRDALMEAACICYPGYDFAQNKGYGSEAHIRAIKSLGASAMHRMSYLSGIVCKDG